MPQCTVLRSSFFSFDVFFSFLFSEYIVCVLERIPCIRTHGDPRDYIMPEKSKMCLATVTWTLSIEIRGGSSPEKIKGQATGQSEGKKATRIDTKNDDFSVRYKCYDLKVLPHYIM